MSPSKKKRTVSHPPKASVRRRVPNAQGKSGLFRALVCVFAITLIVLAVGSISLSLWSRFSRAQLPRPQPFLVESGQSTTRVADRLEEAGFVDSGWLMGLYLATLGRRQNVVVGTHFLPKDATPRELVDCLSQSPSRASVTVRLPEGLDHVRVAQRLEQQGVCSAERFVATVRNRDELATLAITGPDAEGYLFPATYRLRVDTEPSALLRRFVSETRSRLRKIDGRLGGGRLEKLASVRGFGEHEILTLASIVEKEARLDAERPIIASVFFNRLDSASFKPKRMLQSDPTAIYGCLVQGASIPSCREFRQKVLPSMLRDSANPYNTYRHPGLPPGPIASPGEASIESVLNPSVTDYLFFVADGTGGHRFSRTLSEHEGVIPRD